jgi:glycosyltransferase involved in cell wall biosynthesis
VIREISVIVPAASEEGQIGACLASIMTARDELRRAEPGFRVQLIVVLDSCTDGTARAAAAVADEVILVPIAARCVGAARRAGASAALSDGRPACEVWLASTDADCEVPASWLTGMLAQARRGAHVVLGTVLPGAELSPALRARWLSQHRLRDGHPHVHGANLGIRGDAYLALGGWQPMVSGEDAELARRACAVGYIRVSRSAAIPVLTSVRRAGRAPSGFSSYLRALGAADAPASCCLAGDPASLIGRAD